MNNKPHHVIQHGHYFFKGWLFFIYVSLLLCFSCSSSKCDSCIYKADNQKFKFNAYHANLESGDTTYYSIVLKSGSSFFLFQNKLEYKVLRYQTLRKVEWKFKSESTTGFKEDKSHIWLHPPRTDKFKRITQLAPYPQVSIPPKIGEVFDGSIHMATNWGDWSGKSSSYSLKVDSLFYDANIKEKVAALSGCGHLGEDTCCVKFLFSNRYGFYKWDYVWNQSQKFTMTLVN